MVWGLGGELERIGVNLRVRNACLILAVPGEILSSKTAIVRSNLRVVEPWRLRPGSGAAEFN